MIPPNKPKFLLAEAALVSQDIAARFGPLSCSRVIVAGSVRRKKPLVSDVELLYVPKFMIVQDPSELLEKQIQVNMADEIIKELEEAKVLERRKNVKGQTTFGPKIKLMRHVASGIPVDLFSTTEECFLNYLVCRTGPAESNIRICDAAQKMGWKWNPFSTGFTRGDESRWMTSEREVFDFVGLPYFEPEDRR